MQKSGQGIVRGITEEVVRRLATARKQTYLLHVVLLECLGGCVDCIVLHVLRHVCILHNCFASVRHIDLDAYQGEAGWFVSDVRPQIISTILLLTFRSAERRSE
jgi:hypothetical protein